MKSHSIIVLGLSTVLLTPVVSQAADAVITWSAPAQYKDIDHGEQNKLKFRSRVFKSLENHMIELAKQLPDQQTLKIRITDLALAGSVDYGTSNNVRLIKNIDYPKITFVYQLLNAKKKIIAKDKVKLKDMNFMSGLNNLRLNNEPFKYEKHLLTKWFKNNFAFHINHKN